MNGAALAAPRTFAHGLHPLEYKEGTETRGTKRLAFARLLVIPMSQHLGAPAKPIVREGQEVVRGEPIAAAGGFVSVPMHAPATGIVEKIDLAPSAAGTMIPAIYLRPYLGSPQEVLYGRPQDVDGLSPDDLIGAVQSTGMVGLGGAAFPTHVKMKVPEGKKVDVLIVNGCECEPYLTTDHRLMLERMPDLFAGIRIALKATGAAKALVGIEENKPDAIEALRKALPAGLPAKVAPVQTKYPQGAERMLIKALARREVPSGGLPSDAGVVVFNVGTLAQLGYLMPRGQGLIERGVTVAGSGVRKPGNYLVPLGTPLRFLLEQAGFDGAARQVILGGPMMGQSLGSLDVPVTKGVSGILAFTEEEIRARTRKVYPCIRCGHCLQACPAFLNASRLGLLARNDRYELMEEKYHLNDCFECGCCAYACPSNIPLVHYFRMAKAKNRERKAAK
jgi:electron transport complex protein RnfC